MSNIPVIKSKLKVFFSASSNVSEEQLALHRQIVDQIINNGGSITYNWLEDNTDFDPKSITQKSLQAIEMSDLVIAENTKTSTGVGSQIAHARSKNIPVAILSRKSEEGDEGYFNLGETDSGVSAWLYTPENLPSVIKEIIETSKNTIFVKFNFISTPRINHRLDQEAKKLGKSKSEILRDILNKYFDLS